MPMIENSTLVYVINELCIRNNSVPSIDFLDFSFTDSELMKNLDKIEFSPPDGLVRRILNESL